MSETAIIIHTVVAVLATVVLIVRFRLNPVLSLVIGAAYLGLAVGLGVEGTVEAITGGFGDILAEVGLLIAFGVLTGAMLQRAGAIERLVSMLLRVCGPRGMPYATAVTVGTVLQSIFVDVLLVISAPLARRLAPRIGAQGLPRMATALAIGLECGIVLMVPGVGALALAGLLAVPLGTMLLAGFVLVVPTVLIATAIMTFVFRRGWWDPLRDEQAEPAAVDGAPDGDPGIGPGGDAGRPGPASGGETAYGAATRGATADDTGTEHAGAASPRDRELVATAAATSTTVTDARPVRREVSLLLLFTPLLVALLLIAIGAVLEVAGVSVPPLAFVAEPVIALLIGLVGTTAVCTYANGRTAVEESVAAGFRESGQILILTGVGGSLATTIQKAGLGEILGQYFSATTVAPLLMVWVIAAVLHVAIGSVTISAITAAGVLAPVAPVIGLNPVLVALAAGAGSLFAVHVTSNTFWLLQSLMGQTTRGALKTCSVGVSVASVVAIMIILPMSLVL